MSDSDSFIEEVTEEVRRDRMYRIWRKYGPWLITAILAIVIGLMAKAWLDSQANAKAMAATEAFLDARELEQDESAQALLDFAQTEESGLKLLARFEAAGVLSDAGEIDAANAAYQQITEDSSLESLWRDYAAYRMLLLGFESTEPDAFAKEIAQHTLPERPWRFGAAEYQAAAYLRAGEKDKAIFSLSSMTEDPAAPPSFVGYANLMIRVLKGEL